MLMDGFKLQSFDLSQYNNPIEKAFAGIFALIRGIMIALNGVFLFLVFKNKYSG